MGLLLLALWCSCGMLAAHALTPRQVGRLVCVPTAAAAEHDRDVR
jgi:hypothetical protein